MNEQTSWWVNTNELDQLDWSIPSFVGAPLAFPKEFWLAKCWKSTWLRRTFLGGSPYFPHTIPHHQTFPNGKYSISNKGIQVITLISSPYFPCISHNMFPRCSINSPHVGRVSSSPLGRRPGELALAAGGRRSRLRPLGSPAAWPVVSTAKVDPNVGLRMTGGFHTWGVPPSHPFRWDFPEPTAAIFG